MFHIQKMLLIEAYLCFSKVSLVVLLKSKKKTHLHTIYAEPIISLQIKENK